MHVDIFSDSKCSVRYSVRGLELRPRGVCRLYAVLSNSNLVDEAGSEELPENLELARSLNIASFANKVVAHTWNSDGGGSLAVKLGLDTGKFT